MIPSKAPFRRKANWLLALVVEAGSPAMKRYARGRTGNGTLPPKSWKRALILGDNHIGDVLYRSCSLCSLKSGLPDCEFYYLAESGTADILAGNPYLKAVLPWARSDSRLDLSPEHMRELKALSFDAALCTSCIRYWPELLLSLRLGIPNRVAYTYKGFSGWVTHPIHICYPKPFPAYFADYVATLTGNSVVDDLRPQVFPSASSETEAENVANRIGLTLSDTAIAFFLTTRQHIAVWPLARFAQLFELISNKLGAKVVLVGAAKDKTFLDAVSFGSSVRPYVCAGELSLSGLAAFLKRCALVVTTDSGPRHIANAVGTKVLFFRNGSASEVETGKYCSNETDLMPPGEFLSERSQIDILRHIDPVEVLQHIVQALKSGSR